MFDFRIFWCSGVLPCFLLVNLSLKGRDIGFALNLFWDHYNKLLLIRPIEFSLTSSHFIFLDSGRHDTGHCSFNNEHFCLRSGVNFINICQAAFLPIFFCQENSRPNCNERKAFKSISVWKRHTCFSKLFL